MTERNYYVLCDDNCRFEGMTKEQIYDAIAEATGATPTLVDQAFITQMKEQNANASMKIWKGTEAQFNALASKAANTLYFIGTDEIRNYDEEIEALDEGKADALTTYTKIETDALLNGKSNTGHDHDSRYYTETEVNALFNYTDCTIEDTLIVTGVTKTYAGYEIRYYPSLKIYTIRLTMSIAIDSGTTIPVGTRIRVGSIKRGGSYISDVFMQTLAAGSLAGTSSDVNLYGAYIDSNGNVYIYCNVALTNGTKHIGINGIIPAEE